MSMAQDKEKVPEAQLPVDSISDLSVTAPDVPTTLPMLDFTPSTCKRPASIQLDFENAHHQEHQSKRQRGFESNQGLLLQQTLSCDADLTPHESQLSRLKQGFEHKITTMLREPRNSNGTQIPGIPALSPLLCNIQLAIEDRLCDACQMRDMSVFQTTVRSLYESPIETHEFPNWIHDLNFDNHYCPFCRLVVHALHFSASDVRQPLPRQVLLVPELFGTTVEKHRWGGATIYETRRMAIYPMNQSCDISGFHPLGFIHRLSPGPTEIKNRWEFGTSSSIAQHLFAGRFIDDSQVDFQRIRSWISPNNPDGAFYEKGSYEFIHGRSRKGVFLAKPCGLRLIDVRSRFVKNAPYNCDYAALSYVWGNLPQLDLRKKTYKFLTKRGALSDDCAELSLCVKDALIVCEKLGIDFLWVDALCIRQDNPSDQERYIKNMGIVYSRAILTIVAAAGKDTSAGLPGVRPGSRKKKQIKETVRGINLSATQSYRHCVLSSAWASRGWTFQEKELSHQLLIFTDHQVFFQSRSKAYREDVFLETTRIDLQITFNSEQDLLLGIEYQVGDFELYSHLVEVYTPRTLTYPSDSFNAFRGILQSFGKAPMLTPSEPLMPSRFAWGLPTVALDFGLCWDQVPSSTTLHMGVAVLPSWSWIAWTGGKVYGSNTAKPAIFLQSGETSPYYQPSYLAFFDFLGTELGNRQLPHHLQPEWKPVGAEILPLPMPRGIPQNQVLRFWTSSTMLCAQPCATQGASHVLTNPLNPKKRLGRILLDAEWAENISLQTLEFIVIGTQSLMLTEPCEYYVHALCIERFGGVAYRVNKNLDPIGVEDWMATEPCWRYVALA